MKKIRLTDTIRFERPPGGFFLGDTHTRRVQRAYTFSTVLGGLKAVLWSEFFNWLTSAIHKSRRGSELFGNSFHAENPIRLDPCVRHHLLFGENHCWENVASKNDTIIILYNKTVPWPEFVFYLFIYFFWRVGV